MKSFLVKGKMPIVKWSLIPDESYFEGNIPEGYSLAICPHKGYIILDIDVHGNKNGFEHIPRHLMPEIYSTLNYSTPSGGMHIWFRYTGNATLMNKTSKLGIDLRTEKGYVKWYLDIDIRAYIHTIMPSSYEMNIWLESLFSNGESESSLF